MSTEKLKTNGSGKCPVMHGSLTKAEQSPTAAMVAEIFKFRYFTSARY
jgi:hypothetical protein